MVTLWIYRDLSEGETTMPREVISEEQAARLVAACRAAGAGDDWIAVLVLLTLLKFFARQGDAMQTAVALEMARLAVRLDPHIARVSWN
jgi:hypothetical protein